MSNSNLDPSNKKPEAPLSKFSRKIGEPLSKHGWPVWLVYLFSLLGLVYILNPTAGIFEFIPDNIPLIGNIDEAVAFYLIMAGMVEIFEGTKIRQAKKQSEKDLRVQQSKADNFHQHTDDQVIDGDFRSEEQEKP